MTELNDQVLRLVLRLNPDRTAAEVIFTNLRTRISQIENERGNTGDLQRERERADNIHKSITQLAPFIRSRIAKNPDLVFASSPELDEKRGVDLLLCRPTWDPVEQKLILDIDLIQAKSGVTDVDEIQRLGRAYRSTKGQMEKEFGLSESWFKDLAKEITPQEAERSEDVLIEHLAEKKALIDLLESPPENQKMASLREYHRNLEVFVQMSKIIEKLEDDHEYPMPKIELRKFNFFILVKTANGQRYLSAERAATYRG